MSAIVPWNDPGELPCCCVTCEQQPLTPEWRQFELTQAEYAALYAGGIFERSVELSGDFERQNSLAFRQCITQASGSGTVTTQYRYRAGSCQTSTQGSGGLFSDEFQFNTSVEQTITTSTDCPPLNPAFPPQPPPYQLDTASFRSNIRILFRIFDNGETYQHGAQVVLFQGTHGLSAAWNDDVPFYILGADVRRLFTTVPQAGAPDNAFLNFTILGRTIPIPHRLSVVLASATSGDNPESGFISKNLNVLSHTLVFSPSAP